MSWLEDVNNWKEDMREIENAKRKAAIRRAAITFVGIMAVTFGAIKLADRWADSLPDGDQETEK